MNRRLALVGCLLVAALAACRGGDDKKDGSVVDLLRGTALPSAAGSSTPPPGLTVPPLAGGRLPSATPTTAASPTRAPVSATASTRPPGASPTRPPGTAVPVATIQAKRPADADKESLPLVQAIKAQDQGFTGSGVSVAVLDTGADYKRAAFGPCTAANAPATVCRVLIAEDMGSDDEKLDDDGHGTNVAAIVAGVAPGARLIILDVFDRGKQASDSAVLKGLDWVVKNKETYNIVAVNMSLGSATYSTGPCAGFNPYKSAFSQLRLKGVIPVVASGNAAQVGGQFNNGIGEPACTPGALSVGAVYDSNIGGYRGSCTETSTKADGVTCFSQSGPNLGMLAPGARIAGAGITYSGTSQAAPHVAGAVAALASKCAKANVDQLQKALTENGPTITDPRNQVPKHRLDVLAAGQALQKEGLCS